MRDYGKVFSRIWESQDFRALSEDGRSLVLYLLTCQHGTIAGVFRVPDGYACEDLQWSSERVAKGFSNLNEKGFATRCEVTKWVWVTKYLEWNKPENPNQCIAARKVAQSVPDQCTWKPAFMRACGPSLGIELPAAAEPLTNPLPTIPQPVLGTGAVTVTGAGAVPPSVGAAPNPSDPPAPPPPPKAKAAAAAPTRGTRLPKDWTLTKPWGDWALKTYPLWTVEKVRLEAEKFRNHWTAKGTKDAAKLDWYATWQNWCHSHLAHKDDPKSLSAVEDDRRAANARATAEAADLLGFAAPPPEEIAHA